VLNQVLKLLRLGLVDDCYPAFIIGTFITRVEICLNPAHVGLYYWTFILDPFALGVFVRVDRSGLIMVDVVQKHLSLMLVSSVWNGALNVVNGLLEIPRKFSIKDIKKFSFEFDALLSGLTI
jgi:hypothetical protein